MGKSIRSKVKRKFRAIKREKNAPQEKKRLEKIVLGLPINAERRAREKSPDLWENPDGSKRTFSYWEVVNEMKAEKEAAAGGAMEEDGAPAATQPKRRSRARTEEEDEEMAAEAEVDGNGDAVMANAETEAFSSRSQQKKLKTKLKLKRKGITNKKRFNL